MESIPVEDSVILKESPLSFSSIVSAPRHFFVILLLLGFGLRVGYGVVRYRGNLEHLTGPAFVSSLEHDALVHVLIAKALLSGKGYIVDDAPLASGKRVPDAGKVALFKAPLYEFFLAGVFAISGFSFKLFFPLQALFGGLTSAFTGLITLQTFRRTAAAWIAGALAAAHPILVNSASQPYNEDIFFFFFVFSIWAFLLWLQNRQLRWALVCGVTIGLCMLTRENGILLAAAMGIVVCVSIPWSLRRWIGYGLIGLGTIAVVAPWTIHNYVRFGVFVPVASIVGEDLLQGNNACVAAESLFTPFWAEGSCRWIEGQRHTQPETVPADSRVPDVVLRDRASRDIAVHFILANPGAYAKMAFRRFWTTLLPFDPRGNQRSHERIVLALYWLAAYPAGIAGFFIWIKRFKIEPGSFLLVVLVLLNLMSISAVLYWSDLRFRVGIDLLLGSFAAWTYTELFYYRQKSLGHREAAKSSV